MRYLFFTNTPAHVHLYKHAARNLSNEGHEVQILARDYGCTLDLLEYEDLPYKVYGSCSTSKTSLFRRLPGHYYRIARLARRFDPDIAFGIGAYAAHGSVFAGCRCVLVIDSEPTTIDHHISKPFADIILTPTTFRKRLGANHYEFNGFKESAYLHPDVYTPNPAVRDELGVGSDEPFVIVRFNAFGSHHDVGHSGFPPNRRLELIEQLAAEATVFVSDEAGTFEFDGIDARPFELHPARLHDALAEARLLVADTQTMVTEAAMLGTPAVRSNSFVGENDMGNFLSLEEFGLIFNADTFESAIDIAVDLAGDETVEEEWQRKRALFIQDMVNLTSVITQIAVETAHIERVKNVSPWSSKSVS